MLLPPRWKESDAAREAVLEEAESGEEDAAWHDNERAWFMICVLEQRELTKHDLFEALLRLEPLDYDDFFIRESPFFEDNWGPDPPPCTTLGDCLLRRAASLGRVDSAALLLDLGARMDFAPSVLDYEGCLGTPLVNACVAGRLEMVRLLLERGAQIGAWTRCCHFYSVDEYFTIWIDWTALHAACAWGSLEVVQLMVEKDADPNLPCKYSRCEGISISTIVDRDEDVEGPSAFQLACALGHLNIVAFLRQLEGVSVETVGSMYGFSLCGADRVWDIDVDPASSLTLEYGEGPRDAQPMIGHRARGYLNFPDSYGVRGMDRHDRAREFACVYINPCKLVTGTPLLLACVRGNVDVIQHLLDAGADVDACGADGLTPLAVLKACDHTEAAELLLSAAAGRHSKQGAHATPIKTRAQRAGVELEDTPPAVRRDLAEGGPATRARAKADLRAIQKGRVQRVARAEQAGTVRAALVRAKETQRMATARASEPSGSRRVYKCAKCGQPKKGHVCRVK
jgi:ankyrin repeat protein